MLASLSDVSTKHRQGGLFIASQTTDFGTITLFADWQFVQAYFIMRSILLKQ
jgi:hypothetical protein